MQLLDCRRSRVLLHVFWKLARGSARHIRSSKMTDLADVTIRALESRHDYDACVRLQRETWGQDFRDVVPATILMVSQRVGGVAAGAFDGQQLLGFVFGVSGVRDDRRAHWSDMLAVRPEDRGRGIGRRLKCYQREKLLQHGIETAFWSYDPLVAPNAHFNLNQLGAVPMEYVVDMYGDTGSALHRGLETDRLVVRWSLVDPAVTRRLRGDTTRLDDAATQAPMIGPETVQTPDELPDASWVRVAVPRDVAMVKQQTPDVARAWQLTVRKSFDWYLGRGYRVAGFRLAAGSSRPWYALNRSEGEDSCQT